ncbi:MAG: ATP-binding domain-containing protein [Bacteroidales bacterium]|nr:ATP-binding domain-containing protein [Bacteroidales bacterium]
MPSLDSLTPDKFQEIILGLTAERTIVVKGVAGSGKSLTLLKKAKQVSTFSQSYAIVVYTKSLKQFFVDELAEIGQTKGHVYYYAEWKRSTKPNYTYLFVDECQDFNSQEIDDFVKHGQYCWFFGDTNQSIMDFRDHGVQSVEDTARQLNVHTQDLCINHRLTIENAKIGEHIRPNSNLSFACYKHGPTPIQQRLPNINSQLDEILKIKQEGGLTDMGILVFYNSQVEYIRQYFSQKGVPLEWKTKDAMEMDFKSTNPKVLTIHCAKGLQFTDVFIPYCDGFRDEYEKAALYVATTRPLEQLYLTYSGALCSFLPPETMDVYAAVQTNNGPF